MTEKQYTELRDKIPICILELSRNDQIIHKWIQDYCHGQVLTLEEMMWQLIRDLSVRYEMLNRANVIRAFQQSI
jgi:hypothetical protein